MANKDMDLPECWYECNECSYKNKNPFNLKYHLKCHSRNQRIKCPLCSFSAKTIFYVARHLKFHHLNLADGNTPSNPEYLQEIDYVIQTLLEINEKESEDPIFISVNENLDKSPEESTSRDAFIFKCNLCNYFTDIPANHEVHKKAHNQENGNEFKCTLCNYSSNLKFVVIRHMNRDHQYPNVISSAQENHNTDEQKPKHYLTAKGMDYLDVKQQIELVDLCDDGDEEPKENLLKSSLKDQLLHQQHQSFEIEEVECRKQISQYKEEIRLARISMAEMRNKKKQKKEICPESKKQKEMLSNCLKLIRINNQKLTDLSNERRNLDNLRTHIKDTNSKRLQSEFQLRAFQIKELKSKRQFYERGDEMVEFESSDEAIKNLKRHVKGMKMKLKLLRGEERILVKDVHLLSQSLKVVVKIPDQVLQGLQLEIDELDKKLKGSLQGENEDVFNQLIISTEEKIRNLFELKNKLVDVMFLKKSIRRITDGFI